MPEDSPASNANETPSDPAWLPTDAGRLCFHVPTLNDPTAGTEVRILTGLEDANLVSSARSDGLHAPALDIDSPARLVPSSTPGHFHLYLDRPVTWRDYRRVLRALHRAGYIDDGVYWRSLDRGSTFLRLPWVKKTAQEAALGTHDAPFDPKRARRALGRIRRRVRVRRVRWWLTGR